VLAPLRLSHPEDLTAAGEVLASLGIGVTLVDRDMHIQYANSFVKEITGNIACGSDHCFISLWHANHRCSDCLPLLAFRTGEAQEGLRERGKPGTPVETWRVHAAPVKGPDGNVRWVAESFVRVTSLVSNLAGRAPTDATAAALIVVDGEERIVSWSPQAEAVYGYGVEEALGRRIELIIPEHKVPEERAIAARVATQGRVERFETVRRARDGREVPITLAAVALRDEKGGLVGRTCVHEDLSAIHQLRGRVKAQEQLLAHIGREAADAIIAVDAEGLVTSWNRGAEHLLGVVGTEALGRPLLDIAPGPQVERILSSGRDGRTRRGIRMDLKTASGETVPVDVSVAPLAGRGAALVARDVSAQERLDRQLVRSEKLAVVGSLAAGLAHEIGTPLHVISATAEFLMLDARDEARPQLAAIVAETERISRLVRDLLSFARGTQPGQAQIKLDETLARVASLMRFTLERKHATLHLDVPDGLPPVAADPDGLHQVFLNLVVNAAAAIADGGRIEVRAREAVSDGEHWVCVEVSDDGPGVPPALRERIFDPFFTTRPDGTGLGLAVCSRIVTAHGGDLRVGTSALGGASFTVQLRVPEVRE
jgi:PAS domain S-box-containing protein